MPNTSLDLPCFCRNQKQKWGHEQLPELEAAIIVCMIECCGRMSDSSDNFQAYVGVPEVLRRQYQIISYTLEYMISGRSKICAIN